jgi:hypothetical protein
MKKTFVSLLAIIITFTCFGQTIKLTQPKSDNDIKIINSQYTLYMKSKDIIAAISKIDSVMKTDESSLIAKISNNQIRSVDLLSTLAVDKPFIDLLKSNLGSYLLLQGKATIYKGTALLKQLTADPSPEMRDLDGTAKVAILFSEEGSDSSVFLGDLSTKLK